MRWASLNYRRLYCCYLITTCKYFMINLEGNNCLSIQLGVDYSLWGSDGKSKRIATQFRMRRYECLSKVARLGVGDQGRCLPNMGRVSPGDGGCRREGERVCFDARPLYWFSERSARTTPFIIYIFGARWWLVVVPSYFRLARPPRGNMIDWNRRSHFYCRFAIPL